MRQIVECVPNFSEGRRQEVIDQIAAAVAAVSGVTLLDHESDPDHNRTVMTFVGEPAPVAEAAFQAIATAAELIDLDEHEGEHPRMGATDVVPFIPVQGVEMDECIELARNLGQRVADELNIPVYLYEEAASSPERRNLANIRRGEYEGLQEAIATDPERAPDFGPLELGKAGATVIGARPFLIAYNVYLTTDDVNIAREIAKTVRHSSGGLRFVKGLGLLVEGRAQVSMNLTDYTRTSIPLVQELIRREAERYGVGIAFSELVGLIPERALIDTAQWYLQLDRFDASQVLELRMEAAPAAEPEEVEPASATSFLEDLAAGTAAPGGGSAAAYNGAMGAALVSMVARLTVGKKKYVEVEERMQEITAEADQLRVALQSAVQEDMDAFTAVMQAYRLPKETDDEKEARTQAIEAAMHHAAEVPLETVRKAVRVLGLAAEVGQTGNSNAISDAGSAGASATASIHAAAMNVRINADSVHDQDAAQEWLTELETLMQQAQEHTQHLHAAVRERGGIEV